MPGGNQNDANIGVKQNKILMQNTAANHVSEIMKSIHLRKIKACKSNENICDLSLPTIR